MTCPRGLDWTEPDDEDFRRHATGCDECRLLLAADRELRRWLARSAPCGRPAPLAAALRRPVRDGRRRAAAMALAAVALAVALISSGERGARRARPEPTTTSARTERPGPNASLRVAPSVPVETRPVRVLRLETARTPGGVRLALD